MMKFIRQLIFVKIVLQVVKRFKNIVIKKEKIKKDFDKKKIEIDYDKKNREEIEKDCDKKDCDQKYCKMTSRQ